MSMSVEYVRLCGRDVKKIGFTKAVTAVNFARIRRSLIKASRNHPLRQKQEEILFDRLEQMLAEQP